MYCLRWFIPLLLLPYPSAPSLFVFLFLVSYFLHQRPWYVCSLSRMLSNFSVYCSVLLIALFSSTCYWGANETTICEEPSNSSISSNITSPIPSSTPLLNPVLNMLIGSGKYSYQYPGPVPQKEAPSPCNSGIKGRCWLYFGSTRSRTVSDTVPDQSTPNHPPDSADKVDTSSHKDSYLWSPFKAKRKHEEL